MMTVGSTIVLWREERGLSQAELARRAHLSRAQLSSIEFGRRDLTIRTLERIAAALHMRPGSLADRVPPGAGKGLSRTDMDAIASAVAEGKVAGGKHHAVASLLLAVTRGRRAASQGRATAAGPRRGRTPQMSAVALKNALGKPQLDSLLERIDEHVRRRATT